MAVVHQRLICLYVHIAGKSSRIPTFTVYACRASERRCDGIAARRTSKASGGSGMESDMPLFKCATGQSNPALLNGRQSRHGRRLKKTPDALGRNSSARAIGSSESPSLPHGVPILRRTKQVLAPMPAEKRHENTIKLQRWQRLSSHALFGLWSDD